MFQERDTNFEVKIFGTKRALRRRDEPSRRVVRSGRAPVALAAMWAPPAVRSPSRRASPCGGRRTGDSRAFRSQSKQMEWWLSLFRSIFFFLFRLSSARYCTHQSIRARFAQKYVDIFIFLDRDLVLPFPYGPWVISEFSLTFINADQSS